MNEARHQNDERALSSAFSVPRLLLHLAGATLFAAASVWFFASGGGWPLFLVLLLAPDLSM
ncbi:MAG: hypothetical protein WD273_03130 [Trueperaceae bacterium]